MPELPEVETVARGLARRVTGWVIEWVLLSRGDIVNGSPGPICAALHGQRVQRVWREGKRVRIDLAGRMGVKPKQKPTLGCTLIIHLGMTGRLTVADRDAPLAPHTHMRICFRGRRGEVRFCDPRRFGGVWLIDGAPGWIGRRLPPVAADPLQLSLNDWKTLFNRRRQIKAMLLDQDPVSGVGNIYCDERWHRAGIHPRARASDLGAGALQLLRRTLRKVLGEAIRAGGSSVSDYRDADNSPGWFQLKHRVYDRAGEPCRTCGTPIKRMVVAGRGTHLCPHCQRMPAAGRTRRKRV